MSFIMDWKTPAEYVRDMFSRLIPGSGYIIIPDYMSGISKNICKSIVHERLAVEFGPDKIASIGKAVVAYIDYVYDKMEPGSDAYADVALIQLKLATPGNVPANFRFTRNRTVNQMMAEFNAKRREFGSI